MPVPRYEVILIDRQVDQFSAPIINELDEIVIKEKLSWSKELSTDGGFISFSMDPDQQSQTIKDQLLNIAEDASEIRLYRDGVIVQQGPVIGVQTQGSTVNIFCRGLAYYMKYMIVTTELIYEDIDQYTIAKALVDHWQNKDYADFGLDTSAISTSGFLRTITYHPSEVPNVLRKIEQLADNLDGFEFYIDLATRALVLTDRIGSDKSADVIMDSRSIVSPNTHFSIAQGDYGNHAIAIGGTPDDTDLGPIIGTATGTVTQLQNTGRMGIAVSVDGVVVQATIDDYAGSLLEVAGQLHFIPGAGTTIPVLGAEVPDFDAGDTITWIYDHGLGIIELTRDVYKKIVKVDSKGQETMTVEFL